MLSVERLRSGYGKVQIVNDVSLEVADGEILAIIGRNGVGKTTLIKTLIGAIKPMSGRITLEGRDITSAPPSQRARQGIGYVPQGRGIFARLSVGENLQMGQLVGANGSAANNLDRVFDFFPVLKEKLNQKAGTLSGGQQQQLAIGRILIGHPRLILLDEPSEGIQPNIIQEIGYIIRRLQKEEGLTVVVVEQNLDLIHRVADRCAVMDKGEIITYLNQEQISDRKEVEKYLVI